METLPIISLSRCLAVSLSRCLAVSLSRCLAVSLLALYSLAALATETPPADFSNRVVLTDKQGEYPLGRHLMILEDDTRSLGIDDVRTPAYTAKFHPSSKDVPSFGFNPSAYWLKVTLDRQTLRESQWVLEFGYAPMDHVDVYTIGADGQVSEQRGGAAMKVADRPYPHHKHVFELPLDRGETSLYVRVDSQGSKTLPLRLYRADTFAGSTSTELSILSIYVGTALSLIIYNLFIFASIREAVYFHYVLFLLSNLFFHLGINGVSQVVGINDNDVIGLKLIPLSMFFLSISAGLFTSRFLNTAKQLPRLNRIITLVSFVCGIGFVLVWFMPYHASVIMSASVGVSYPIFLIILGTLSMRQGNKAARLYLLAWSMFLLGVVINASRLFGLIGTNVFTEYAMLWGSAAEAVLLSIALAARMRQMKDEKERAQLEQITTQKALNASQQESLNNKQIALDTIQKYSERLEADVKARTAELIETQHKLIASEKLAALGVFTAGMAHEINNPANFVAAGAQNAEYEVEKLQSFVGELLDDDADPDIKGEFNNRFSKIAGAHEVIKTGIKRIENVVKQLSTDHPEGDVGMQPADVVESLESAWRVLSPTVKTPIVLSTQLDARPQVSCMIAEINQVFLALLSNAAHAIEDAVADNGADYRGEIRLASHEVEGKLVITVSDNGIGIPADKIDKVFDPFFTTKTVGRGAGLGLSMARDVIRKHKGKLEVKSTPGEGTTFMLQLPLIQPG